MYSRQIDGDVRSFGVSGKLWHGVLVMYDRESDSLWTQLDGRAIQGSERGAKLVHFPSVFTTWQEWKKAHPATRVLRKNEEDLGQSESRYADYFADPERLFMPHLGEDLGGIGPKETVFGVSIEGSAQAVTEELLRRERVVNAVVAGRPIAWVLDERTGSASAFHRRIGERVLVLEPDGRHNPALLVRDTVTGETRGTDELQPLRVDRAFWYAWSRSHPGSRILAD